jgi:hypothetical protein
VPDIVGVTDDLLWDRVARLQGMVKKWQHDLLAGVPNAKIVELPGANLYMFLSNEADVIRELRELGKMLK